MRLFTTVLAIVLFILNISLLTLVNWYFTYVETPNQLPKYQEPFKKLYQKVNKNLWWKYYYDNTNKNTVIVKKVYYLDWQIVKANITLKNWQKATQVLNFNMLIKNKDQIQEVEVVEINANKVNGQIIFKGEELWNENVIDLLE